jgi:tetraacyldisaccharide-1-P 4'-kinase
MLTAPGAIRLSDARLWRSSSRAVEITQDDRAIDVGDRSILLACTAPVIVARQARGCQACHRPRADVIVMDDGHQNFALEGFVIVIVDGGLVWPAMSFSGPYANRFHGFARADAVIVTGERRRAFSSRCYARVWSFRTPISPTGAWSLCRHRPAKQILQSRDLGAISTTWVRRSPRLLLARSRD